MSLNYKYDITEGELFYAPWFAGDGWFVATLCCEYVDNDGGVRGTSNKLDACGVLFAPDEVYPHTKTGFNLCKTYIKDVLNGGICKKCKWNTFDWEQHNGEERIEYLKECEFNKNCEYHKKAHDASCISLDKFLKQLSIVDIGCFIANGKTYTKIVNKVHTDNPITINGCDFTAVYFTNRQIIYDDFKYVYKANYTYQKSKNKRVHETIIFRPPYPLKNILNGKLPKYIELPKPYEENENEPNQRKDKPNHSKRKI